MGDMVLLILTIVIVATGAMMAALIGLVLPETFLQRNVTSNSTPISSHVQKINTKREYGDIIDYKWLVSVNIPLYFDIPDSLIYICSGVIISENYILTGKSCISPRYEEKDLLRAMVRSNSNYFSQEGNTHSVTNFFSSSKLKKPFDQFYVLEIYPSVSGRAKIDLADKFDVEDLLQIGWGGQRVATENVLKNEKFHIVHWSATQNKYCSYMNPCMKYFDNPDEIRERKCSRFAELRYRTECQGLVNGRPLVTKDNKLIGMECNGPTIVPNPNQRQNPLTTFVMVLYPDFMYWIKQWRFDQNLFSYLAETILCTAMEGTSFYYEVKLYGNLTKN